MLVTFTSFGHQGMFRYHNDENEHREIHPGNIGRRVITAQLLAAGLAEDSSRQEKPRRSKRKRASRRANDTRYPAAPKDAARKRQRREKDVAHREACAALQEHPIWAYVEGEQQVTRKKDGRAMTFHKLKLSEAACCEQFGERLYSLLERVGFARCVSCEKVFIDVAAGLKHRCKPKDTPHQPLQRQQQAGPVLQGGMQLDTAVLAQVSISLSWHLSFALGCSDLQPCLFTACRSLHCLQKPFR